MKDSEQKSELFSATRWSMVLAAGDREAPGHSVALNQLFEAYWYPIYAYIRGQGHGPEDAKDLTQDFVAAILRRGTLANVSPERGRFRNYLLASLKYFLSDESSRAMAQKRGGGLAPLPLDSPEANYALEQDTSESPDVAFDRRWAVTLSERAITRLRDEHAGDSVAAELFHVLRGFLAAEPASGEYEEIATRFAVNANTVAQWVRRLRVRLRKLILEEISHTVATPAEAEAELRALF
jgi:RNA polymerase sigma factor (sigma-70 family)